MEKELSKHLDKPKIGVDVLVYNSKFFYIVVEDLDPGDHITRVPGDGQ